MRRLIPFFLLLLAAPVALAADWSWTDVEGRAVAPFADSSNRFLVAVFIGPDCPVANYFQPTLRRLAAETGPRGVAFVYFHADPDVGAEVARKHIDAYSIEAPVVLDPKQETARRLRAEVTPEVFLIDRSGAVHYRGRIDNTYIRPGRKRGAVTRHDLRDAIAAALAGDEIETPRTQAVGCYIHYPKTKKEAP